MNHILKRQTPRFHYGSKVSVVTITTFITIQEQNRKNSCQSSTKFSEVNVKEGFTSHSDKNIFVTFLLTSEKTLEKTERGVKDVQSRDTDNINFGYRTQNEKGSYKFRDKAKLSQSNHI